MLNSLLLDIVTYLTAKGVIEGDGIDTFRDFIPETPDCLVSLTEYKGSPVVPYESTVHRSVQILVRDTDADVARRRALEIYKVLTPELENLRVDFTDERWGQVSLRQTPYRIRTDSLDRVSYGFNVGITTTIE